MSLLAAPARWPALHSSWVQMSSQSAQLVVVVTPRAGDEAVALPARLSEITGRSRTQISIELQRGEVEVLRSADRGEVSRIVEQLAAIGLLAVVREASLPDASSAPPAAGEGWGRVLGAFDAKVAVAPSRLPERHVAPRGPATESWQPSDPIPLRLGDAEPAETPRQQSGLDGRGRRSPSARAASANEVALDLMREAGGRDPHTAASRRGARQSSAKPKRPSARTVVVSLVLLVLAGLGYALYERMHRALSPTDSKTTELPVTSAPEAPSLDPASAAPEQPPAEQVGLLVDRAREACRTADFERCKGLADQALDLEETNRAAQALHIRAVTAISARAGRPGQPPPPPAGPQ
jgi:hypothetical protein